MILPKIRDPRFITVRRGGALTDADHHLLALWAATCAEHILPFFEAVQPADPRPRRAIEQARAWMRPSRGSTASALVLDDQRLRNGICWSVFDC